MDQDPLEILWDGLLSRDAIRIRTTFTSLDETSKDVVLEHLERMTREAGWHEEQVKSAQIALDAIRSPDADGE
jgi:hypothetical protein